MFLRQVTMIKAALRSYRRFTENPFNRKDPVNHLPMELVEEIFLLAMDCSPTWYLTKMDIRSVIRLSHVSHAWRQVTLNLPRLWAYVNTDSLPLAAFSAFLERSRTAPLYVTLTKYDALKVDRMRSQTHRIRALHIRSRYDEQWTREQLCDVYDFNLPELKYHVATISDVEGPKLPLPWPGFLQTPSSKLQTLHLYGAHNLPPATRFPVLRDLNIMDCRFNLSAILELLSHCPLLEKLNIADKSEMINVDETLCNMQPMVPLDRLVTLHFETYKSDALTMFFSKVTALHRATEIFIAGTDNERQEVALPRELSQAYAIRSTTALHVMIGDNYFTARILGVSKDASAAVYVEATYAEAVNAFIPSALSVFPSTHLREIWVGPDVCVHTDSNMVDMTMALLRRSSGLRTLVIHIDYVEALLDHLSATPSPSEPVFCPQLEVLRIGWGQEPSYPRPKERKLAIPNQVLFYLDCIAKLRPMVQLFARTIRVFPDENSSPRYSGGEELTPCPLETCNITASGYFNDWIACFNTH